MTEAPPGLADRTQESLHMKVRLIRRVPVLGAHRTRPSCEAAALPALPSRSAPHVPDACLEIVGAGTEGADGAGGQARPGLAARAWRDARPGSRQIDGGRQQQGAAIGMPQAPPGMDEQADRARMYRLAAKRQALKGDGRCGRAARIDIRGAQFPCEGADHPVRPAVEGMRHSIARLGCMGEVLPLHTAGEAEQDDGTVRAERAVEFPWLGMERAAHGETHFGRASTELIEGDHGQASYVRLRGEGGAAP